MTLPPTMLDAYLARTWFGDDAAWDAVVGILRTPTADGYLASIDPVSDSTFDSASPEIVRSTVVRQTGMAILTIADEIALTSPGWPILLLSLLDPADNKPFRCTAEALPAVECNLTGANVSWFEYTDLAGDDGVFRGFG